MATDNKTLGRFDLTDIPSAPRGVPQIEVSFDIDANGIVHVAAKDLGTGKEQSIKITSSSGLSKEEIDQLIKDAELHADEDHKKKDLVEARNKADALVYQTEKSLKEFGDKVDSETKGRIESSLADLKKAMESDDSAKINSLCDELTQASHKLAEAMYQQSTTQAGAEGGAQAGAETGAKTGPSAEDDVVDADFEEVKDDKK